MSSRLSDRAQQGTRLGDRDLQLAECRCGTRAFPSFDPSCALHGQGSPEGLRIRNISEAIAQGRVSACRELGEAIGVALCGGTKADND